MKILRLFLTVYLLLILGVQVRADYLPLTMVELVQDSQLIVLGKIESVLDDSFTLRAAETYSGDAKSSQVQVVKYRDWTGGRRWSSYREGQEVLLFLRRPEADEDGKVDHWRIRGRGGEGEMPISAGAVFPHGLNLKEFRRRKFKIDDGEIYGYRFDLKTFISALKDYRSCFGGVQDASSEVIDNPARNCTESELAAYRAKSDLHRYLLSSK